MFRNNLDLLASRLLEYVLQKLAIAGMRLSFLSYGGYLRFRNRVTRLKLSRESADK
jgi:hypothetical protein